MLKSNNFSNKQVAYFCKNNYTRFLGQYNNYLTFGSSRKFYFSLHVSTHLEIHFILAITKAWLGLSIASSVSVIQRTALFVLPAKQICYCNVVERCRKVSFAWIVLHQRLLNRWFHLNKPNFIVQLDSYIKYHKN